MRRQGQTVGGRCGAVGGVVDGGIGRRKQRHTLRDGIRAWGREGGGGQWGHERGSSGWAAIMRGSGRSVNGGVTLRSRTTPSHTSHQYPTTDAE